MLCPKYSLGQRLLPFRFPILYLFHIASCINSLAVSSIVSFPCLPGRVQYAKGQKQSMLGCILNLFYFLLGWGMLGQYSHHYDNPLCCCPVGSKVSGRSAMQWLRQASLITVRGMCCTRREGMASVALILWSIWLGPQEPGVSSERGSQGATRSGQ